MKCRGSHLDELDGVVLVWPWDGRGAILKRHRDLRYLKRLYRDELTGERFNIVEWKE